MKLLHYVADTMFARNHLSFTYLKDQQYFLMPTKCFNESSLNPYWKKSKVTCLDMDLKQHSKNIVDQIEEINPDAILFSYVEPPLEPLLIELKSKYPVYYMHHGIYCDGLISKFKIKKLPQGKHRVFTHFTKIFFTPREIDSYFKLFMNHDCLVPIKGYVGLDLYHEIKKENPDKDNRIMSEINDEFISKGITDINGYLLLVGGKLHDEYLEILRIALEFAIKNSWVVITKMKPNRGVWDKTSKHKLHQNPRVKVLLDYEVIYDYLFADLILIQRYSTVYYESLALKKPTLLCQLKELSIKFQGINKFPHLPQAYQSNEILPMLRKTHQDQHLIAREEARIAYLFNNFGSYDLENVTQKIYQTICSKEI